MRVIAKDKIINAVAGLCLKANLYLRKDILLLLKRAYSKEKNKTAKHILKAIIENAAVAKEEKIAICQDTGMPVIFLEIGNEVNVKGDLKKIISAGVKKGYQKGYFRNSIVADPILRGRPGYLPPVVHIDIVKGNRLKLTVLPKGFGCENKSRLKMFNPTAGLDDIKDFIVQSVKLAGADACPPYVIGVGIGGTADYACFLAKKALLRSMVHGQWSIGRKSEAELLKQINKLNIGPMGLGGRTTALALKIEKFPTHIAGLPVAVNISCHALRSATVSL